MIVIADTSYMIISKNKGNPDAHFDLLFLNTKIKNSWYLLKFIIEYEPKKIKPVDTFKKETGSIHSAVTNNSYTNCMP